MRTWWPAIRPSARIQPRVGPARVSRDAWPPAAAASRVTAAARLAGRQVPGHLDGDPLVVDGQGQARDAGPLDERGGGAQGVRLGGQRPGWQQPAVLRRHEVTPLVPDGRTASLVTAPGRGMTFANDAGPRRNADAPPSPAAAGSRSASVPAARTPLTVR